MTRKPTLKQDASNRALRTFIQGIAIDMGVALAVAVYAIVSDPNPIVWAAVGASVARSVLQAGAAYVMRRFMDPSRMIPTPLPPEPVPEPAD